MVAIVLLDPAVSREPAAANLERLAETGVRVRRFDPAMLGRTVRLDGVSRRVVGIMPRGFALPTDFTVDSAEPGQAWIPLQIDPKQISHDGHNFYAAATLVPGATASRATAELKRVTANLTRQGVYRVPMRFEAVGIQGRRLRRVALVP